MTDEILEETIKTGNVRKYVHPYLTEYLIDSRVGLSTREISLIIWELEAVANGYYIEYGEMENLSSEDALLVINLLKKYGKF